MNISVRVDNNDVDKVFTAITKNQKKILKRGYKKATSVIVKDAKKNMKASFSSLKYSYNGTTVNLQNGIRTSTYKDGSGASVYERSPRDLYYILLFHDFGAKGRKSKKKGRKRKRYYKLKGGLKGKHFFQNALSKRNEAVNQLIKEVETQMKKFGLK